MRGNNWLKFTAVIVTIILLTVIAALGPTIQGFKIRGANDINFGIDIRGGVYARMYAITDDGKLPSKTNLDTATSTIGKRLDFSGITDRVVTPNYDGGYIIVEIPAKKGIDPKEAIKYIGNTAKLTFREVDEKQVNSDGTYKAVGKVVVDGKDVVDAKPEQGDTGIEIALTFNDAGTKAFADATASLIGKRLGIYLDDKQLMAPTVNVAIPDGKAVITNIGTAEQAKEYSDLIRSGALPFKLEARQYNSISPTLGESALKVSIYAGIVAFIIVCLFMIGYYRLPGIFANIALWGHTVIQLLAISWLNLSLTLPGIAGVILTIGMGVDANVIIFERIKEELKNGKTLRAAIDVGFKRAFTAILDANMTTLIAAGVLWKFGSGPMVSFAYTLGIGVILSFLTAVTASRIMLRSVSDVNIAKHHWLYGA
jgi:preprotein translocase subunit SecD